MSSVSRTPSLTPSRSPSPEPPVQPDHFYGSANIQLPPSPDSDGHSWLDPAKDPLATRGIPVFKPTMGEFQDFEAYVTKIECWGNHSGIVKIIPPEEWTASLPPLKEQLNKVKIKTPIEQHMLGRGGLFRQENMEKRKIMSVREWVELCNKEEFRAPAVEEIGLHARSAGVKPKVRKTRKKGDTVKAEASTAGPADAAIKQEPAEDAIDEVQQSVVSPPPSDGGAEGASPVDEDHPEEKPKVKGRRVAQTRAARDASLADRAARDSAFLETFDPHAAWLPANTKATDYTPEFCQKLERNYWRNCGLGRPAWYGADTQGSLYTDETTAWNVAHLESTLSRILPSSDQGLPGVNTPYLYFGMWRATFAWHVEDMDLFSINYIHFGAPKFWYSVPQGRAVALERTMRDYFPKDTSQCPQFLRHKSFLASPTLLAQNSCRPNHLVQHAGEFVITFPRGYHAGFNLGLNCAESVNFALDSWLELGKRAKACECVSDSVRIDVDQLLMDRASEKAASSAPKSSGVEEGGQHARPHRKRKPDGADDSRTLKKIRIRPTAKAIAASQVPGPSTGRKPTITLTLGPRPVEPESFPCCLCISTKLEGLLRVHDPPVGRKDTVDVACRTKDWMAHEECAKVVPETWVDEVESKETGEKEKIVFGVDGIVKDRWNLKCTTCTKNRPKAHGAPIQCTKGKCPKAFHVSCARDGSSLGVVFSVLREVEKEVVLLDPTAGGNTNIMQVDLVAPPDHSMNVDGTTVPPDASNSRVLKVIKKLDVQVLCSQHNPAIAAAKKASKQDKIKNDLLALPTMARIKIRVSAGVFEVSLIRVIEESKSIEVLWDRGIKREFKWGSVVFGSTDGPVQQKPSELAPEVAAPPSAPSANSYRSTSMSITAPPNHTATAASSVATKYVPTTPYPYPQRSAYDYWSYQGQGNQIQYAAARPQSYGYGYYPPSGPMVAPPGYNPYSHYQNQFLGSPLQWQQPYQGPPPGHSPYYPAGHPQPVDQSAGPTPDNVPSSGNATALVATTTSKSATPSSTTTESVATPPLPLKDPLPVATDLAALASLTKTQITELFKDNPQLRDIVLAAVEHAKKATAS